MSEKDLHEIKIARTFIKPTSPHPDTKEKWRLRGIYKQLQTASFLIAVLTFKLIYKACAKP